MFTFAGFSWTLWTTRNKMAIEQKFPKSPSDIMYLALSYLQKVGRAVEGGIPGADGGSPKRDYGLDEYF